MVKRMSKKIYVVGLGPGGAEQMTGRAKNVLADCDIIVGYKVYIDLIRQNYSDKELYLEVFD